MNDTSLRLIRTAPDFYHTLFADLRVAAKNIRLEIYSIAPGLVVDELKTILIERVRAGLSVRLIYDSLGSMTLGSAFINELTEAGVKILEYHPINPRRAIGPFSIRSYFRRDHRKLIIIDETIWYLGGMNIGERYIDWVDIMARGVGSPVHELCASFDRVFEGRPARPTLPLARRLTRQLDADIEVCDCRPTLDNYPIKRLYLSAIKKAERRIWIAQAYFLPRRRIRKALIRAVRRGVDVHLVIPDVSDVRAVDLAAWPLIGRLVRQGVHIHRHTGPMLHTKMALIDDHWLTLGTANLDSMSMHWNLEINLALKRAEHVRMGADIFEDYLASSRPVMPGEAEARPFALRMAGRLLYTWSWIL